MIRRQLDAEEQALWARVIATVRPIEKARPAPPPPAPPAKTAALPTPPTTKPKGRVPAARPLPVPPPPPPSSQRLDGSWDRKISKGRLEPDLQIDLHGRNLAGAYDRLDGALEQAVAMGYRTILLVTGRDRGHDRASGEGRGAIRAAVRDWLAASRHAGRIASVRGAHPRHGGEGALYIVLRKSR
ncbi:MAG: DNA mismatch repair protein MutS [Sphingorhabdus sp.]|nr:DNA mismatch repair protein MutS [Sphingorhabdus sp.]|tara:strand:- start:2085 stop:2639 length:555 start_codon:yes stop_codon:yes gene_type:complete